MIKLFDCVDRGDKAAFMRGVLNIQNEINEINLEELIIHILKRGQFDIYEFQIKNVNKKNRL